MSPSCHNDDNSKWRSHIKKELIYNKYLLFCIYDRTSYKLTVASGSPSHDHLKLRSSLVSLLSFLMDGSITTEPPIAADWEGKQNRRIKPNKTSLLSFWRRRRQQRFIGQIIGQSSNSWTWFCARDKDYNIKVRMKLDSALNLEAKDASKNLKTFR